MSTNLKASIIIPAYNSEKYIARAIESALGQTEQSIEVIVVDDASTDATVKVVKGFSDERLILIVNECNHGPSYSRNCALREAKGEWIALLDSDDWYAPERIERLLQIAHVESADLIADDIYFIQDGDSTPYGTLFSIGEKFEHLKQIDSVAFIESSMKPPQHSSHFSTTKPLMRHSFLLEHGLVYNEVFQFAEDLIFYQMCLANGAHFIIVAEPYYFYRRNHQDSLVSKICRLQRAEVMREVILYLLKQEPIMKNPRLVRALSKFLAMNKQSINYHRAMQVFREKGWRAALGRIMQEPHLFTLFITQIPEILHRRVLHYFGKGKDI